MASHRFPVFSPSFPPFRVSNRLLRLPTRTLKRLEKYSSLYYGRMRQSASLVPPNNHVMQIPKMVLPRLERPFACSLRAGTFIELKPRQATRFLKRFSTLDLAWIRPRRNRTDKQARLIDSPCAISVIEYNWNLKLEL